MEWSYPQAFFSSPGLISVFVIVMLAEILSLGFLGLASFEFRQMMRKHAAIFREISNNEKHERMMLKTYVFFWIYIISTLLIALITTSVFLFQPHIL